jgi:predicted lactoylglutathione lyase
MPINAAQLESQLESHRSALTGHCWALIVLETADGLRRHNMSASHPRKIFVNLPVRDLKKSMAFFSSLGFEFNRQFTDEKAACMILSDEAYVMLLSEPFFKTFTKRELCDTGRQTEGLFALSCANRAEVDELVTKAIAAGGTHAMDPQDHGFMYGWSFYDLDGHHWEVLWMDPNVVQQPAETVQHAQV